MIEMVNAVVHRVEVLIMLLQSLDLERMRVLLTRSSQTENVPNIGCLEIHGQINGGKVDTLGSVVKNKD
jgi:hypothetical protein